MTPARVRRARRRRRMVWALDIAVASVGAALIYLFTVAIQHGVGLIWSNP